MPKTSLTPDAFLNDPQGKTFVDVINDPEQPFGDVLEFFGSAERQRRMEASELHHDRAPLAGVVRELEAQPAIDAFLASDQSQRSRRFRQAVGVLVRMIMEQRGWQKTGRKGSLGVRMKQTDLSSSRHNSGGLAFWFVRAERYELPDGMPFRSVGERCEEINAATRESKPGKT